MIDLDKMDARYVVFGSIFLLANRLQTVMDKSARDITAKQWFLLMVLGLFDAPPTLSQLASAMDSSHQNVKQLALKLEKKGFVRIQPDPDDRRALRIVMTDAFSQWDRRNRAFQESFIGTMFRDLTEQEIHTMKRAQLKLYDALQTMKEGKNP